MENPVRLLLESMCILLIIMITCGYLYTNWINKKIRQTAVLENKKPKYYIAFFTVNHGAKATKLFDPLVYDRAPFGVGVLSSQYMATSALERAYRDGYIVDRHGNYCTMNNVTQASVQVYYETI